MALAYLGTLAPEVRPAGLLASLPAASLFLGLSPSYFDNPLHIRLLCPRDFPGKNTGVSCHFLLLPDLGIESMSPALAGRFFTSE